jgi:hypothetical protein
MGISGVRESIERSDEGSGVPWQVGSGGSENVPCRVSALERDFAASIPPYLGANVRPANIDDANLKEDLPLISQPDDVYTVGILLSLPHYTSVRSD